MGIRLSKKSRTFRLILLAVGISGMTIAVPLGYSAASASTPRAVASEPVAVIDAMNSSEYGTTLEVGGNGKLKGAPLYMISSDTPTSFGCTTKPEDTYQGTITCTGPESDIWHKVQSDEWPAFTTNDQVPEVGPGVDINMVGLVHRDGIGWQVTYNHHPLYLFDPPSSPFDPQGENFLETVQPLPPWHGLWDLVSATGRPVPGPATIETETLKGATVLASEAYDNIVPGGVAVTAYSFSSSNGNECDSCYPTWIPVLSTGAASASGGANAASLGTLKVKGLGEQVTYNGDPLYIYSGEMAKFRNGNPETTGTKGNGNGLTDGGGVFSVVTP